MIPLDVLVKQSDNSKNTMPPNYRMAVMGGSCSGCQHGRSQGSYCAEYGVNVDPQATCDAYQPKRKALMTSSTFSMSEPNEGAGTSFETKTSDYHRTPTSLTELLLADDELREWAEKKAAADAAFNQPPPANRRGMMPDAISTSRVQTNTGKPMVPASQSTETPPPMGSVPQVPTQLQGQQNLPGGPKPSAIGSIVTPTEDPSKAWPLSIHTLMTPQTQKVAQELAASIPFNYSGIVPGQPNVGGGIINTLGIGRKKPQPLMGSGMAMGAAQRHATVPPTAVAQAPTVKQSSWLDELAEKGAGQVERDAIAESVAAQQPGSADKLAPWNKQKWDATPEGQDAARRALQRSQQWMQSPFGAATPKSYAPPDPPWASPSLTPEEQARADATRADPGFKANNHGRSGGDRNMSGIPVGGEKKTINTDGTEKVMKGPDVSTIQHAPAPKQPAPQDDSARQKAIDSLTKQRQQQPQPQQQQQQRKPMTPKGMIAHQYQQAMQNGDHQAAHQASQQMEQFLRSQPQTPQVIRQLTSVQNTQRQHMQMMQMSGDPKHKEYADGVNEKAQIKKDQAAVDHAQRTEQFWKDHPAEAEMSRKGGTGYNQGPTDRVKAIRDRAKSEAATAQGNQQGRAAKELTKLQGGDKGVGAQGPGDSVGKDDRSAPNKLEHAPGQFKRRHDGPEDDKQDAGVAKSDQPPVQSAQPAPVNPTPAQIAQPEPQQPAGQVAQPAPVNPTPVQQAQAPQQPQQAQPAGGQGGEGQQPQTSIGSPYSVSGEPTPTAGQQPAQQSGGNYRSTQQANEYGVPPETLRHQQPESAPVTSYDDQLANINRGIQAQQPQPPQSAEFPPDPFGQQSAQNRQMSPAKQILFGDNGPQTQSIGDPPPLPDTTQEYKGYWDEQNNPQVTPPDTPPIKSRFLDTTIGNFGDFYNPFGGASNPAILRKSKRLSEGASEARLPSEAQQPQDGDAPQPQEDQQPQPAPAPEQPAPQQQPSEATPWQQGKRPSYVPQPVKPQPQRTSRFAPKYRPAPTAQQPEAQGSEPKGQNDATAQQPEPPYEEAPLAPSNSRERPPWAQENVSRTKNRETDGRVSGQPGVSPSQPIGSNNWYGNQYTPSGLDGPQGPPDSMFGASSSSASPPGFTRARGVNRDGGYHGLHSSPPMMQAGVAGSGDDPQPQPEPQPKQQPIGSNNPFSRQPQAEVDQARQKFEQLQFQPVPQPQPVQPQMRATPGIDDRAPARQQVQSGLDQQYLDYRHGLSAEQQEQPSPPPLPSQQQGKRPSYVPQPVKPQPQRTSRFAQQPQPPTPSLPAVQPGGPTAFQPQPVQPQMRATPGIDARTPARQQAQTAVDRRIMDQRHSYGPQPVQPAVMPSTHVPTSHNRFKGIDPQSPGPAGVGPKT